MAFHPKSGFSLLTSSFYALCLAQVKPKDLAAHPKGKVKKISDKSQQLHFILIHTYNTWLHSLANVSLTNYCALRKFKKNRLFGKVKAKVEILNLQK